MSSLVFPRLGVPPVLVVIGEPSPPERAAGQRILDEWRAAGIRTVVRSCKRPDWAEQADGFPIVLFLGVGVNQTAHELARRNLSARGLVMADPQDGLPSVWPPLEAEALEETWQKRSGVLVSPPESSDGPLSIAIVLSEPEADSHAQRRVVAVAEQLVAMGQRVRIAVLPGARFRWASQAELATYLRERLGATTACPGGRQVEPEEGRLWVQMGAPPLTADVAVATDAATAPTVALFPQRCLRCLSLVPEEVDHGLMAGLAQALGLEVLRLTEDALAAPSACELLERLRTQVAQRGDGGAQRPRVVADGQRVDARTEHFWLQAGQSMAFCLKPTREGLYRIDLRLVTRLASAESDQRDGSAGAEGRLVLTLREAEDAPEYMTISTVPVATLVDGFWTAFEFPPLRGIQGSRLAATLTLLASEPRLRVGVELAERPTDELAEHGAPSPAVGRSATEPAGEEPSARIASPAWPACRWFAMEPPVAGSLANVIVAEWLVGEELALWRSELAWQAYAHGRERRWLELAWWLGRPLPPPSDRPWRPDSPIWRRFGWALRFYGPRAALEILVGSEER